MNESECIFCKIVRGEIPCARVLETPSVLAFLDIAPAAKGHVLVIPKAHHESLLDLPPKAGQELLAALQDVAERQRAVLGAEGMNVLMNVFQVAGQLVPHAHFHVIPRFRDDGLLPWAQGAYDSTQEMAGLAARLRGEG